MGDSEVVGRNDLQVIRHEGNAQIGGTSFSSEQAFKVSAAHDSRHNFSV
jgi:hypothetical protein